MFSSINWEGEEETILKLLLGAKMVVVSTITETNYVMVNLIYDSVLLLLISINVLLNTHAQHICLNSGIARKKPVTSNYIAPDTSRPLGCFHSKVLIEMKFYTLVGLLFCFVLFSLKLEISIIHLSNASLGAFPGKLMVKDRSEHT